MTTASVSLWGRQIGAVSMGHEETYGRFEYDPDFVDLVDGRIEIAPIHMPLKKNEIYSFRDLDPLAFHGLPGLLADALPDKFGNKVINMWLAKQGRSSKDFNAVDRLCYTGARAMGALEFLPATEVKIADDVDLEVAALVDLAGMAVKHSERLDTTLDMDVPEEALRTIFMIGSSAGGARAKAVIAYDPETNRVRSGHLDLPQGFEHWLIKFDGIDENGEWGVSDPKGYGRVEYAYHRIARDAGINMTECRLLQENGRAHFMTKRFDRTPEGKKVFVQSFAGLQHFDYNMSGLYSYEQLFMLMKKLECSMDDMREQYRRMVFNLVGKNQDDHVKNFSFSMSQEGDWSITPAYDLCYSAGSAFTKNHQLSLNGKVNDFTLDDLKAMAIYVGLPRNSWKTVLEDTLHAFQKWEVYAEDAGVPVELFDGITPTLRRVWK